MTWWKFMFDTKTPTWQAYGRAVFVQAETESSALVAARAAASADYPGAEIRDVAMGESTAEAAEAFAEKKRRISEWQANARLGVSNTRATLEAKSLSGERREVMSEQRQQLVLFAGFISTALPELHHVEASRMVEAVDAFLSAVQGGEAAARGVEDGDRTRT